jgi:ribonuclease Y
MVEPDKVNDLDAYKMAREIKDKIEQTMTYPGQIKVAVIRELRAEETAK